MLGDLFHSYFSLKDEYVISGISCECNQSGNIIKLLKIDLLIYVSLNAEYISSLIKNTKICGNKTHILIISDKKINDCFSGINCPVMMLNFQFTLKELQEKITILLSDKCSKITDQVEHYHLTEREKQILYLIYLGKKTREIANELFISYKTVENHRNNILTKTNSKNMLTLINYLHKIGYFLSYKSN